MFDLKSFTIPKNFRGKNALIVQLWWCVQASIFSHSPQIFYKWRVFLLRIFGAKIGENVIIRPSAKITYPWKLAIGNNSWIGDDVILYSLGEIKIGDNTVISQRSYLCTGGHNYNVESFDIYAKPIVIGNGCWLAMDVFVAPGIVIENNTIVGARSSIFKCLPGNSICFGNPASKIRDRE